MVEGGRQLEDSVATFDVLPEVRKAVGPDVEVIMDGGVRRGIDVVKAIARGADSVACGRAYLFGLAAGGFMLFSLAWLLDAPTKLLFALYVLLRAAAVYGVAVSTRGAAFALGVDDCSRRFLDARRG